MDVQIEPSWKQHLAPEFEKPYFVKLTNFVRQEYRTTTCYPPGKLIFNAFNLCPYDKAKVVIIGQDPYHGPGQAHGLCFSVNDGVPFPPSLQNIFKEIQTDLGTPVPQSGNLTRWAEQGVLLLNATLTVRAHQAGSHQRKNSPMRPSRHWPRGVNIWFLYFGVLMPKRKERLSIVVVIWYWLRLIRLRCQPSMVFSGTGISAWPMLIWSNMGKHR